MENKNLGLPLVQPSSGNALSPLPVFSLSMGIFLIQVKPYDDFCLTYPLLFHSWACISRYQHTFLFAILLSICFIS